jgi:hypothetical protein
MSHMNSCLNTKLRVRQIFWTKTDLINVVKWWHVKNSL